MTHEQKIEQRVVAIEELCRYGLWHEKFARIAHAELVREGKLVEALCSVKGMGFDACGGFGQCHISMREIADCAVRAYEAEFAPPLRTVEQIAADIGNEWRSKRWVNTPVAMLLDELAAALKRGA